MLKSFKFTLICFRFAICCLYSETKLVSEVFTLVLDYLQGNVWVCIQLWCMYSSNSAGADQRVLYVMYLHKLYLLLNSFRICLCTRRDWRWHFMKVSSSSHSPLLTKNTFNEEVGEYCRFCVCLWCDLQFHLSHPSGRYSSGTDRNFALLEDVFKKFPGMPVSIEIKENNNQLIKAVQYTKKKKLLPKHSLDTFPKTMIVICSLWSLNMLDPTYFQSSWDFF